MKVLTRLQYLEKSHHQRSNFLGVRLIRDHASRSLVVPLPSSRQSQVYSLVK